MYPRDPLKVISQRWWIPLLLHLQPRWWPSTRWTCVREHHGKRVPLFGIRLVELTRLWRQLHCIECPSFDVFYTTLGHIFYFVHFVLSCIHASFNRSLCGLILRWYSRIRTEYLFWRSYLMFSILICIYECMRSCMYSLWDVLIL